MHSRHDMLARWGNSFNLQNCMYVDWVRCCRAMDWPRVYDGKLAAAPTWASHLARALQGAGMPHCMPCRMQAHEPWRAHA